MAVSPIRLILTMNSIALCAGSMPASGRFGLKFECPAAFDGDRAAASQVGAV